MTIAETTSPRTPEQRRFAEPIKEGDDVRARMNFLAAQHGSIVTQTQFADAKAAALMTVMSLIALRSPFSESAVLTDPLDLLTYAMLVLSVLFCLAAIIPRYPSKSVCDGVVVNDKFSWVGIAASSWSLSDHHDFAREADLRDMIGSLARGNVATARVLRRKFFSLRWAFWSGILAVVLMTVRLIPT
jgi:hypothetical protein